VVLCACRPVSAQSPAGEVETLRQEAAASRTKTEADQKLDQAEALLAKSRKSMDSLDYTFLQNEITQARGLVCIAFWQRNRNDVRLRDEGRRLLLTALDKYDWLGKRSEDRAEAIEDKFSSSQLAKNKLYKTVVGNISRANYKKAWTEYLLGMSADRPDERQKRLKSGLDGFISFTARGYRNDPIVADCFIGQARCLYELERYFEVTEILDPEKITNSNTTPNMFRRVTGLRIKAYEALSRHLMVDDCANSYFESLPGDHSFDAAELEIAVAWARSLAFLISDPVFDKYSGTYERRLAKIRKIISPHGEPWRTRLAAALRDSGMESPLGYVERARQYFIERRYEQAVDETERGLAAVAKEADADDIGVELLYIQFAVYWNQNRWPEAHRAAAGFLENHPDDRRAEDVCNKAVESGIRALKSEPPLEAAQFLKLLEYAEENFPDAAQVKKAPWYKGHLLLQEDRYAAAIETLKTIPDDSPVYRQAQLDLARASFKKAEVARKSKEDNAQELAALYLDAAAALRRFADESSDDPSESDLVHSQSAVEIAVPTADRLLHLEPPEPNSVLLLIDRIKPLQDVTGKPESRLLAAAAEANLLAGNTDIADKLVDELLDAKSSEPHMVIALINVANRLEQIRARIAERGEDVESTDQKLVRIYVSLLNLIGKNEERAIRDREPSVRLHLAKRLSGLGRHKEAIDHYRWYLKNTPAEKSYDAVRELAITYERIGQYEPALRQWSRLYRGMKRRTDEWIEAAYHIIDCHIKVGDHGRASKVLAQFRALCPRSELGEWDRKFEAVEKKLLTGEVGTTQRP
jgi:tetratricopeptide (TPR) repeat protein